MWLHLENRMGYLKNHIESRVAPHKRCLIGFVNKPAILDFWIRKCSPCLELDLLLMSSPPWLVWLPWFRWLNSFYLHHRNPLQVPDPPFIWFWHLGASMEPSYLPMLTSHHTVPCPLPSLTLPSMSHILFYCSLYTCSSLNLGYFI